MARNSISLKLYSMLLLNIKDQVQWSLSLLIIRLANYSITTSLIYKSDS